MIRSPFLSPPDIAPERILFYGSEGTGKSNAWMELVHYVEPTVHFYVIDTDYAMAAMLMNGDYDTSRFTYSPCHDWMTFGRAALDYFKRAKSGDFIIVDLMSTSWQWAQDATRMQLFNVTETDLLFGVEKPEEQKRKVDFWTGANSKQGKFLTELMRTSTRGVHVIGVASERQVRQEGMLKDDPQIKSIYGEEGFMPVGSRHDGHVFNTIIHCKKLSRAWTMTSVKDRERELMVRDDVTGKAFAEHYLVGVAGWEEVEMPRRRRRRV